MKGEQTPSPPDWKFRGWVKLYDRFLNAAPHTPAENRAAIALGRFLIKQARAAPKRRKTR